MDTRVKPAHDGVCMTKVLHPIALGIDRLSLARELRLESEIGIIMLTAREGEVDRVLGLEWGLTIMSPSKRRSRN